jgi:DNA-binding GntR family transcriptional regulator
VSSPNAISRAGHTFSDQVEAVLREQIVSGARAAGSRLNEVEIAAELQVSRGPVREAIQRLAGDRLVQVEPHRGAFVRALHVDEVRHLFEVRIALECAAAELAAQRADDAARAAIRALLDASEEVVGGDDPHYPQRLDLHRVIVRATGNRALEHQIEQVDGELRLARAQSGFRSDRAPRAVEEHAAIVAAIEAGDGPAARAAMARHLSSSLAHTLALLDSA